ncbi:MAG TPA: SAM-dependent methyltransferase [Pirellulales bacterium]|nr:SAM-dependent methyltransferase [Pirellulales bacterium]
MALASQCLPAAEKVEAASISQWAVRTADWLLDRLAAHSGPWRLHVFCVAAAESSVTPARCRYVQQAVANILAKKQRRLRRSCNETYAGPLASDEWLLQVGMRTATEGYLSALPPLSWPGWRRCVSRFPGGRVDVPADRRAPSRAFAKLAEVELRLARQLMASESCVDLGSSPGSWAYWALKRGATVVAVDRSPLRTDLMREPRLTFIRGDAFRYRPTETVDWLLCDVIAFPAKTIARVERWLSEGWCRWFCVTIKFRGQADYDQLEPLKAGLSSAGHDFYLRRLTANKNEVMLFGRTSADGRTAGGL